MKKNGGELFKAIRPTIYPSARVVSRFHYSYGGSLVTELRIVPFRVTTYYLKPHSPPLEHELMLKQMLTKLINRCQAIFLMQKTCIFQHYFI